MKRVLPSILLLIFTGISFAQLYQGPAAGSVSGGAVTSTDNFPERPLPDPFGGRTFNRVVVEPLPDPSDLPPPSAPEGSNYVVDPAFTMSLPPPPPPITIASFPGIPQTNSIPPDPYMAAGPDHIMQVVNTSFRISDKQGNTLKTISATSWFNNVYPSSGAFDPKVHYDHYAGRWIMVWLQVDDNTQTANFLVSVSDDSNPIGTWYNWALPSNVNGNTASGNWADYQGVGFDEQALYFTSNQFSFGGSYAYVKVRVMAKAQFYTNNAGPIAWNDFWDLRDANLNGQFTTRPVRSYGYAGMGFLVGTSPFTTGTYFTLYRVLNPTSGTPSITAVNVPVTSWTSPPNANQLGGGALLIEAGGSRLRNEPIYKDSSIWAVHSVRSGTGGQYSSVRYLRFNLLNNTAEEDITFGVDGFWHFYPAIQVDRDKNIAITFSRSANTEYVGAYFTWRLLSDPPGLRASETIQAGKANYVKDFGSGRNRWGDYMGIALDPVDQNHIWMFTEYAEAPANTWGVWVHNTRLVPFPGRRISLTRTSIDFGSREATVTSDTSSFAIYNYGVDPLSVSSITNTNSVFTFVSLPSFPVTINTFDSIQVRVVFRPVTQGVVLDSVSIASNDTITPVKKLPLRGKGVIIGQAQAGVIYAASAFPTSQLFTIDGGTGAATAVGATEVTEIQGLAIRPTTRELYGTYATATNTTIYRVSAGFGDALPVRTIPVASMRAIAFSATDTLYGATTTGRLYRIDLATGDTAFVGSAASVVYSSLSFNPLNQRLWASVRPTVIGRDNIYTVSTVSGAATLVGTTGFNVITPHIAFDALGKLYGIIRTGSSINDFIRIDTANAAGTLIGATGVSGLLAMAMRPDSTIVSVGELPTAQIPTSFELQQNYPNPFNPTTEIRYALPVQSRVRLSIYNLLGQEIARLVDGNQAVGVYEVEWDGRNGLGMPLPSGVYLYRIDVYANDETAFSKTRKMLLMK